MKVNINGREFSAETLQLILTNYGSLNEAAITNYLIDQDKANFAKQVQAASRVESHDEGIEVNKPGVEQ